MAQMPFTVPSVRLIPDPILERPTTTVTGPLWSKVSEVEGALRRAMKAYPAVGFAANQLGYDLRVFIMEVAEDKVEVFVNPKIITAAAVQHEDWEGCMSLPDKQALVSRSVNIAVQHDVGKGKSKVTFLMGYPARIAQHEIDHLDGITILDRAIEVQDVDRDEQ